jgi:hypothetical protein
MRKELPVVKGEWTKEMSPEHSSDPKEVKSIAFGVGNTAIGRDAPENFPALESVEIPPGCTTSESCPF